jgi:hypothetical protein
VLACQRTTPRSLPGIMQAFRERANIPNRQFVDVSF